MVKYREHNVSGKPLLSFWKRPGKWGLHQRSSRYKLFLRITAWIDNRWYCCKNKQRINRDDSPFLRDNVVKLVKGGTIVGDNKALTSTDWPNCNSGSCFSSVTYGSPSDLWGTTWTASDINSSNFGVVLSAINSNTNGSRTRIGTVDYIQMTVYYTPPIVKTNPVLSVTNSPVIYNGTAQSAVVTGSVAGTVSNILYDGSATVPTATGTYAVTADFAPDDTINYNSLSGASAGSFIINEAPITITSVNSLDDINVANGTTLGSIGLPSSVVVTLSDGSTPSLSVVWDGGTPTYDGATAGAYVFSGDLALPSGVTNPSALKASVRVIVAAPVPTLQSIAITTPASKLSYYVGDGLDITGLIVTGTYSDTSSKVETVTIGDISGFDSSAPVTGQVLTITVNGQAATYTIDIVPAPIITPEPTPATTTPSEHHGGGFAPGWGPDGYHGLGNLGDEGQVLGTSTERNPIIRHKLTDQEKKMRDLRRRLNGIKIGLYDLRHPHFIPQGVPVAVDFGTSSASTSVNPVPLVSSQLTVTDTGEIATGTRATGTPKKPWWKIW